MNNRTGISFFSLLKTVVILTIPALVLLLILIMIGTIGFDGFLYSYLFILVATTLVIAPFLDNITALTAYVDDLADDKQIEEPKLGYLSAISNLPQELIKLHYSWENKRRQMSDIITEREILVDSLPDILVMCNDEQIIVRTNKAARTIFGQNLAGKSISDIIPSDEMLNGVAAVISDLRGREVNFRMEEPAPRDFRAIIERFPAASSGGISLIITLNDVTELRRVEKMRADFVANASHEIRTPLASIKGFIETLRGPAKDDLAVHEEFLKVMDDQANRMINLINDLLSLSKIEMNSYSVPQGKVDILRIIRNEKENFSWAAKDKNMEIILDIPDNLPFVRGEERELMQVIHNLLGNAIKYGNTATDIKISGRVTSVLPNDPNFVNMHRAIVIAVIDKGEGIGKEHLPRLTERFYRVDSARTRTIGGTGLGLAIVKHIIHRHRGVLK
ncbi:MAG: histidine kinase dimerization/phospho-acceptor domain-containing protein, partial [Pseudomonadota bacterium]